MTTLSWNLGALISNISAPTNHFICNIASCYVVDFIFLSETKCSVSSLEPIFLNLGFNGCIGVDVESNSGGLFLCWAKSKVVSILSSSKNVIVCSVSDPQASYYNIAFVYGSPYVKER